MALTRPAPRPGLFRVRFLRVGGRLDRYVGSLFMGSYAVAFLVIVGLFLIIEAAVNLDEYLEPDADGRAPSVFLVLWYYVLSLPFLYLQVAPFITLVAGLFTTAKLVRHREVIAALDAGVSSHRMLAPLFVGATVLAGVMFGVREWAAATIAHDRDAIEHMLLERRSEPVLEAIWLNDRAGNPIFVDQYLPGTPERPGARLIGLEITRRIGETWERIEADMAVREERNGVPTWRLEGGRREAVDDREQRSTSIEWLDDIEFTHRDVEVHWKAREKPLELSLAEVRLLARRDPDNLQWRTLLQYHLTFPLANLVLLAVGLPFLMNQERGRGIEGVAAGFVLCVFYFGMDFITRSLGMEGVLSPLMASWLPVLFFGSLGAVLFGSMRS